MASGRFSDNKHASNCVFLSKSNTAFQALILNIIAPKSSAAYCSDQAPNKGPNYRHNTAHSRPGSETCKGFPCSGTLFDFVTGAAWALQFHVKAPNLR
jgi:hypothetical protein